MAAGLDKRSILRRKRELLRYQCNVFKREIKRNEERKRRYEERMATLEDRKDELGLLYTSFDEIDEAFCKGKITGDVKNKQVLLLGKCTYDRCVNECLEWSIEMYEKYKDAYDRICEYMERKAPEQRAEFEASARRRRYQNKYYKAKRRERAKEEIAAGRRSRPAKRAYKSKEND